VTTCSIDGCTNQAHGRGWCNKHYERWRINGSPHRTRTVGRRKGVLDTRTLDMLGQMLADGGWLTAEGVALMAGRDVVAVERSLYRLRKRGLVESRRRAPWQRTEWHATEKAAEVAA